MKTVTSKDGTTIAFDEYGTGPTVIFVGGATQHRAIDQGSIQIAQRLANHFTVLHYDRRGRGDSTNTLPFAVEREIEDIDVLISAGGGSAYLFGNSSGAALAMEAAIELGDKKVKKLAMYEAPYNSEANAQQGWKTYRANLDQLLAENRKSDAAALFFSLVGMPAAQIEGMRHAPVWPLFESVAPTLAYDAAVMGDGAAVPTERAAQVTIPTLVMAGGASYPFMNIAAVELAKAMPKGQHRLLEGQTHQVDPEVLASVLDAFFIA